jgi:SNF2 family DNA or RNA helicase
MSADSNQSYNGNPKPDSILTAIPRKSNSQTPLPRQSLLSSVKTHSSHSVPRHSTSAIHDNNTFFSRSQGSNANEASYAAPLKDQQHSQPSQSFPKLNLKRISSDTTNSVTSSNVNLVSERPFVLRFRGICNNDRIITRTRGIARSSKHPLDQESDDEIQLSSSKRKRSSFVYQEIKVDDSDDLMDTDEEKHHREQQGQKSKKKQKIKKDSGSIDYSEYVSSSVSQAANEIVDSPPPGVLPNLWYSREEVLHVWVIEKIIGWKTRPVFCLQDTNGSEVALENTEAQSLSNKALACQDIWKHTTKRMEVSRIHPSKCPMVVRLAAKREQFKAEKEGRDPQYSLSNNHTSQSQTEEVLLVKWRGRSYMHVSWERAKDLIHFDQSNNTARGKIRRYTIAQEAAYGRDWKAIMQNGLANVVDDGAEGIATEEERFPPQYLEVERLMACDESEMDMSVFSKQRAYNIREEEKILREMEDQEAEGVVHLQKKNGFDEIPLLTEGEEPWDPEDYVRYVIKWKGLQYSEMTWEYWMNIKRDAVTQAEDFWLRQQAPDPEDIRKLPPHPHMRDFRKLSESPAFGVSKVPRPVADLGDGNCVDEDEGKEEREFKLRSYQLEGVNWLLFNWWNKRSCIL